jgi:hypothetical protein
LTNSPKCDIIIIESEERAMTIEELVNYNFGVEELNVIEDALEMILDIDENITVKKLLEIIKKPIDIKIKLSII